MPWTKRDVIAQAMQEIGKGEYDFDISPESYQSALRQLDAMMATWGGTLGVRIGYSGGDGFGNLSAETEVPDWSYEALYLNLALRIAPGYGKTTMPDTKANAKFAYDAVMLRVAQPETRHIGGYGGAGNNGRKLPDYDPNIATGNDGLLDFGSLT